MLSFIGNDDTPNLIGIKKGNSCNVHFNNVQLRVEGCQYIRLFMCRFFLLQIGMPNPLKKLACLGVKMARPVFSKRLPLQALVVATPSRINLGQC
jgi:hypothetical protein